MLILIFMYLFRNHLRLSDQLIFISYSRQDGVEFANKLAKDIRDRGGNTWIDKENIPDGSDWNMEIENAMTDSVYVLYVVTEAAKKSPEVKNEIQYAKEENKKLIPLQIDKKCKRPLNIRIIQYVDFTKDYTEGLNRLCKTLHLNGETGKQILNAKEPLPKINTAFKDSGLIKNTRNKSAEKIASKHTGVATVSKKISGVDSTAVKKKFNLQSAVSYSAYADPFWWILFVLVTALSIACTYYASQVFNQLLENFHLQVFQFHLSLMLVIIAGTCWGLAYAIIAANNAISRKDLLLGVGSPFLNIILPDDIGSIVRGLFSALFLNTFITMFASGVLAIVNKNAFSFEYSAFFLIAFIIISVCSLFVFATED